jgi:hypothetical protein
MPKVNFDSNSPTLDTMVEAGGLILNGSKVFMITSYIPNDDSFEEDFKDPLLGYIDLSTGEFTKTGIPFPSTINKLGRTGCFSSSFDYIPCNDYSLSIKKD